MAIDANTAVRQLWAEFVSDLARERSRGLPGALAHVRLGRQDVERRLERFIAIASPVVAARAGEINYVDLRYSNGFSIGWNAPTRFAHGAEDATPDA